MSTKRTVLLVIGSIFLLISTGFLITMAKVWSDASVDPAFPILIAGVLAIEAILGLFLIGTLIVGIVLIRIGLKEPDNFDKITFGKCLGEHPKKEADCKLAVRKYGSKYAQAFETQEGEQ